MTAKQLLYFVTIAETGSFTLAAEKLNLSQPPLSKQIMLLEKELDTQLLIRSSRRIKLTESGILLYNRAKDILRLMDSAATDLGNLSGKTCGTVRLGIVHSMGDLLLNERLSEFLKECPNVTLDLYEADTNTLLDQIKSGTLDAAIVQTPFNPEGLECRYLPEDSFAVFARHHYLPAGLETLSASDLIGQPLIYCRSFERMVSELFDDAGLPYHCLCKTSDIRTALLLANSGHGIAIVPDRLARLATRNPDMQIIPLTTPDSAMQFAFVYKKNTRLSKSVQTLVDLF